MDNYLINVIIYGYTTLFGLIKSIPSTTNSIISRFENIDPIKDSVNYFH